MITKPKSKLPIEKPIKTSAQAVLSVGYTGALDELVVTFTGFGLYIYNKSKGWTQINTHIPKEMILFRDGIVCNFGSGSGLWFWGRTKGWEQINSVDPGIMIAADIDGDGADELIVYFDGYGLYAYDPDKAEAVHWTLINTVIPESMVRFRKEAPTVTPPPPPPPEPDPYEDPNYTNMTPEERLDALLGGWLSPDGKINYDSPLCPFKR
jgi:hypothetical protein